MAPVQANRRDFTITLKFIIACVASVSVRLSARSRHFSLFWPREKWGERKKVRSLFQALR